MTKVKNLFAPEEGKEREEETKLSDTVARICRAFCGALPYPIVGSLSVVMPINAFFSGLVRLLMCVRGLKRVFE